MSLQTFIDRFRIEPRLVAKIEASPDAERGLQQIEHFFQLLEMRTDLVSLKLKAQLEEIISGDGTISARCLAVQRTIRNAVSGIIRANAN
jgi:hypothetical protein